MTATPSLTAASLPLARFAAASEAELGRIYDGLFERIAKQEQALRVFEPGEPDRAKVDAQLRRLFAEYPEGSARPPLFGVPVGVKDIYRLKGEPTRCGSLLPPDLFAGKDAAIVKRLRKAGAVMLGRTATTEFAYFEPAATCNPHNPGHTPGGSSSGSAAGVAAGFFPLALGTQTVGSVIRPAAYCGITGFKPSYGRLPAEGLLFFSRSVDHVGFFCADPGEAQAVMAAVDPDWQPAPAPDRLRLGVPSGPYLEQASPDALDRFHQQLRLLGEAGTGTPIEIVDAPCLEDMAAIAARHGALIARELADEHAAWFDRYEALYRPRTSGLIRQGRALGDDALAQGRASCAELRARLHGLLNAAGLDAFICPAATGEADAGLASTGSPAMNLPWTHAGLPALTVPAGTGTNGLPLGLQLVGRFGADPFVLAAGSALYRSLVPA